MPARPTTAEQLAALTAIVERIDRRAEEDRAERKQAEHAAQRGREAMRGEIQRHGQEIQGVRDRLDRIEPVAEMATGFKAKAVGALFVLGLLGSAIMFTLTFFKDKIVHAFGG